MKKAFGFLTTIGLVIVTMTATSFAAGAVIPEDGSLMDLAKPVYEAVMGGQYWLGASLALVLLVTTFKRYAPGKAGEFARSDAGGSLLVLLGSFGGALATGLMAAGTSAVTLALAWTALKVAFGAAGGYALIKKLLVEPLLKPLSAKTPAWMQPFWMMLFWAFDKPTPTEAATVAGNDAVASTPSTGVDGVTGPGTKV